METTDKLANLWREVEGAMRRTDAAKRAALRNGKEKPLETTQRFLAAMDAERKAWTAYRAGFRAELDADRLEEVEAFVKARDKAEQDKAV